MEKKNIFYKGILFGSIPRLNQICQVVLEIDQKEKRDLSVKTLHQWQILKCRIIIFSEKSVLAAPVVSAKHLIMVMASHSFIQEGRLDSLAKKNNLNMVRLCEAEAGAFLECLRYSLQAHLAPSWNYVENFLIQGREFLMSAAPLNAINLQLNLQNEELILAVSVARVRLPRVNFDTLVKDHDQKCSYLHSGDPVWDLRTKCIPAYVLPSMKKGHVAKVWKKLPLSSPFKSYDDIRKHWKNTYGYRLGETESSEYVGIVFWGGCEFTYPIECIRSLPPIHLVHPDPHVVIKSFILDLTKKVKHICGTRFILQSHVGYTTPILNPAHSVSQLNKINITTESPKPLTKTIEDLVAQSKYIYSDNNRLTSRYSSLDDSVSSFDSSTCDIGNVSLAVSISSHTWDPVIQPTLDSTFKKPILTKKCHSERQQFENKTKWTSSKFYSRDMEMGKMHIIKNTSKEQHATNNLDLQSKNNFLNKNEYIQRPLTMRNTQIENHRSYQNKSTSELSKNEVNNYCNPNKICKSEPMRNEEDIILFSTGSSHSQNKVAETLERIQSDSNLSSLDMNHSPSILSQNIHYFQLIEEEKLNLNQDDFKINGNKQGICIELHNKQQNDSNLTMNIVQQHLPSRYFKEEDDKGEGMEFNASTNPQTNKIIPVFARKNFKSYKSFVTEQSSRITHPMKPTFSNIIKKSTAEDLNSKDNVKKNMKSGVKANNNESRFNLNGSFIIDGKSNESFNENRISDIAPKQSKLTVPTFARKTSVKSQILQHASITSLTLSSRTQNTVGSVNSAFKNSTTYKRISQENTVLKPTFITSVCNNSRSFNSKVNKKSKNVDKKLLPQHKIDKSLNQKSLCIDQVDSVLPQPRFENLQDNFIDPIQISSLSDRPLINPVKKLFSQNTTSSSSSQRDKSSKRQLSQNSSQESMCKKPRSKPQVKDVDVASLARSGRLNQVNAPTLVAYLKTNNLVCKAKDKKGQLIERVLSHLGLPTSSVSSSSSNVHEADV